MNIQELKTKLSSLGRESGYSLDGKLIPDRYILKQSGEKWAFFYLDDHGKIETVYTNDPLIRIFDSESEACDYIAKLAEDEATQRARRVSIDLTESDESRGIIHNYLKKLQQ